MPLPPSDWLNPFGMLLGLDGVILLAYIIAIPANEIVVPTMMMVYIGAGMMINGPGSSAGIYDLLVNGNGWTMLTAVNLMLFALLHNPCATTIMTILQGNKKLQVGDRQRGDHTGHGITGHLHHRQRRETAGLGMITKILNTRGAV